jgi:thioredoxin-like negative regulator of GroEL
VIIGADGIPGGFFIHDLPPYQPMLYPGDDRPHRDEVVVESPTVREPRDEIVVSPPDRVGIFDSPLSGMLGGAERVDLDFSKGEDRLWTGSLPGAVEAFRRAVAAEPESPVAKLALALGLTAEGRYASAAHLLRRGLRGHPDWTRIHLNLAEVMGSADAAERTLDLLRRAVEDSPEEVDLRLLLGFWLYGERRADEAAEHLLAAVEAAPEDTIAASLLDLVR